MAKRAIIVISLVKESEGKSNNELEKEIFRALSTPPPKIPWMKNVEKVTVIEKA